jgi:phage gp36-like protein
MMAYCDLNDLLEQVPEAELIGLTDDANAGEIDESAIARAIADADAEINAYLGQRYAAPLDPVPEVIRKISVDLAVWNLLSRRGRMEEVRTERYRAAIRFLERVSKGEISLGAEGPASDAAAELSTESPPRLFTREKLGGF